MVGKPARHNLPHGYFESTGYPEDLLRLLDTRVITPETITDEEKLIPNTPQIIMLSGLQGSGKTAMAGLLQSRLGEQTKVLKTDTVRDPLIEKLLSENYFPGKTRLEELTVEEKYAPQVKAMVYEFLFSQAIQEAHNGPVIVDATFFGY